MGGIEMVLQGAAEEKYSKRWKPQKTNKQKKACEAKGTCEDKPANCGLRTICFCSYHVFLLALPECQSLNFLQWNNKSVLRNTSDDKYHLKYSPGRIQEETAQLV